MKTQDHRLLSEYLIEQMDYPVERKCKQAFLLGTVEPDYNPFSYLRGCVHQQTLRGHNYENVCTCIRKLIKRLQKKKMSEVKKCFLLGKLIHYTADAFTFPHNKIFEGSLREHCSYEARFHNYFCEKIQSENVINIPDPEKELFYQIEELHQSYLEEKRDYLSDYLYILRTTSIVFQYFTESEKCPIICLKEKIA